MTSTRYIFFHSSRSGRPISIMNTAAKAQIFSPQYQYFFVIFLFRFELEINRWKLATLHQAWRHTDAPYCSFAVPQGNTVCSLWLFALSIVCPCYARAATRFLSFEFSRHLEYVTMLFEVSFNQRFCGPQSLQGLRINVMSQLVLNCLVKNAQKSDFDKP